MGTLEALVSKIRALGLKHAPRHESGGADVMNVDGLSTDAILKATLDANTIIKADTDDTPVALAVAASRILGRKSSGGIAALTAAEVATILTLSAYVTKALFDANTILVANSDDTPVALTVAASRFLGRKAAGNIAAMTGAEAMALLTGQAGADFAMNTHKITGVVDPAANQDAATKNYADTTFAPLTQPRVRAFRSAVQTNIPDGAFARVEMANTTFDTESAFKTGTWQAGVGDAGSNATTIVDADPTTGTGFVASMTYALVTWDAGASTGYITSVDSGTQLTIVKNLGTDFTVGDSYTIAKAHYEVPTAGYWMIMGLTGWLWSSVIGLMMYQGGVTVNGVLAITSVIPGTQLKPLSQPFSDIKHLAQDDIVALYVQHRAGANTPDIGGDANGRITYLAMALLEAD